MAFCPHCGKSVTDQASKCLACGKEFEPRAKAARFKGTMMMSPAAAAPLAPKPAAQPAKPAPAPAAPAPAAPAAAKPTAPSKVAKHTMLGTGGMGLAPPPQPAPRAPTPAPAVPLPPPAAGSLPPSPQPAPAAVAKPAARGNVWDADASADTEPPPSEDSGHFISDEPPGSRDSAQYQGHGRESGDTALPTQRTGKLLVVGIIGVLVIAALGYFAAKMMGLG
jgi:hypothetical protein